MRLSALGIIPDGNRRWAAKNFLNLAEAYFKGSQKGWQIVEWVLKYPSIKAFFIYLFSSDNIKRRRVERIALKKVVKKELEKAFATDFFDKNSVRVRFVGDKSVFGQKVMEKFIELEKKTAKNSRLTIVLCIGYSGKQEIVQTTKKLAADFASGKIKEKDFSFKKFCKNLFFQGPFPDLVIRTGGEKRVSDFMVFQIAHSQLVFVKKFWSELKEKDFREIIDDFISKEEVVSDFD